MLLNPPILALHLASLIQAGMLLFAAGFALKLRRHWDMQSGSERQVTLERRTYLVATLIVWVFVGNLLSLWLFVYTAEQLSGQFVGAMCATGVLNANVWGWPTLLLKLLLFFGGATWLILNWVDQQSPDYPLVRAKYAVLLLVAPLAAAELATQWLFFGGLKPDLITSCCGFLFGPEGTGVVSEVAGLDPGASLALFYGGALLLLLAGYRSWRDARGGRLFAVMAAINLVLALLAILSAIALYVYEHPHHHCPFCLLKAGHGFIGYWLYIPLLAGTALALGVGMLQSWRALPGLGLIIERAERRLSASALAAFLVFHAAVGWVLATSNLVLMTG